MADPYSGRRVQKYSELKTSFLPLDLLMFRGADLISSAIRIVQGAVVGNNEFSHVGIVVTSDILPHIKQLKPGQLYVWESTMSMSIGGITDGVPDVESGKGRLGVQIRNLDKVVPAYCSAEGAQVAWARLQNSPWLPEIGETVSTLEARRKDVIIKMAELHKRFGRKIYEVNPMGLLGAIFPCFRELREDVSELVVDGEDVLSWVSDLVYGGEDGEDAPQSYQQIGNRPEDKLIFCSELVALIYKSLGIIPSKFKAANVVPVDFLGIDREGMPRVVDDPVYVVPDQN